MALVRRDHFDFPDMWKRFFEPEGSRSWVRMEEFEDGETLVLRAELPGIDPEKDVEITISNGLLQIQAKREEKSEQKEKDSYRSEFHYGSFFRAFPLPVGVAEEDVKASYNDGILEIRVPIGESAKEAVTRVPVTRS